MKEYWEHIIKKFISFAVSLKVYILTATTVLLIIDKINEQTWSTVIIAIALGRIAVQGIATYGEKKPLDKASKSDTLD